MCRVFSVQWVPKAVLVFYLFHPFSLSPSLLFLFSSFVRALFITTVTSSDFFPFFWWSVSVFLFLFSGQLESFPDCSPCFYFPRYRRHRSHHKNQMILSLSLWLAEKVLCASSGRLHLKLCLLSIIYKAVHFLTPPYYSYSPSYYVTLFGFLCCPLCSSLSELNL